MKFRILLVLLTLVAPTVVNALGLGKLELLSALNQPFKARVELLSATVDELDSLKVSLADQEAFERAGIQRTFLLTSLRFRVEETESGSDYIRIHSSESIREPFLNFLLEINWSKGRLFREYTVLLDPPTYTSPGSKKKVVIHPDTPVVEIDADDHQVVYDLEYKPESKTRVSQPAPVTPGYEPQSYEPQSSYAAPPTINYAGSGDYGPAVTGDTLWSIAKAARPDTSVSIQQMMLAILNANPEAFIENNINGLKRGAILEIPDATEVDSLIQSDALAQVINQHALWDEYKGHVSTYVSQQPESSEGYSQAIEEEVAEEPGDVEQESTITDVGDEGEAELRLISETDQDTGSDQSTAGASGVDALNNELALANESIEALFMENAELKDKLTETEGIIDDLKRLIVLKEDELAAMQEQIMIAAAEQESADAITDETMAEEELVEEIEATTDEEPVEEEELVVEDEEELVEEEEEVLADDEVIEEVVVADDEGMGALSGLMDQGMAALSGLKDQGMDMLEKAKANLMIVGGAIGGLLLLAFLMIFVSKRRSAKATVIELPAEDFPDFSEEIDSEKATVIPGSEDETVLPGDDAAEAEADIDTGDEEKTTFLAPGSTDVEADVDAFEVPEETAEIPQESAPEIPEEDPMEEVNVFLAYEHFDEAESFVKKALEDDPDNLNFHSKLLEVFYAAGNKKSYEEAARVVNEKTGGEGEYWDAAVAMWQELSPNRVLFETPIAGEDEVETSDSTGGGVLNIAADEDGSDGGEADMDFNIGSEESEEDVLDVTATADSVSAGTESSESLDLDTSVEMDISAGESEDLLDSTVEMSPGDVQKVQEAQDDVAEEDVAEEALDLSLGEVSLDLDTGQQADDSNELDISFGDTSGEEDSLDVSIAQDSGDSNELDIDFGDSTGDDGDLDLLGESVDTEEVTASASADELDLSLADSTGDDGDLDLLGSSSNAFLTKDSASSKCSYARNTLTSSIGSSSGISGALS